MIATFIHLLQSFENQIVTFVTVTNDLNILQKPKIISVDLIIIIRLYNLCQFYIRIFS